MTNALRAFGSWVLNEVFPFLWKHRKMVWLTVSITGLIVSVMFDYKLSVIAGLTLSAVISSITVANLWRNIFTAFGALLMGKWGGDTAAFGWFLVCFFVGSVVFFVNPTHSMSQSARPAETMMFTGGFILFIISVFLFFKNRILR